MKSNLPRKYTKEEIRQAIASESKKQLEELNSDYLIGCSETGQIPKLDETIRFGDLPLEEQACIRRGLESCAKGEIEPWEFK